MSSYKKHLLLITGTMVTAISIVFLLAWISLRPLSVNSGFNRTFVTEEIKQKDILNKNEDIDGIAGIDNDHIYFKTRVPNRIFITDTRLRNGYYKTLNFPFNRKIASAFNTLVDADNVHVMANNGPNIIKASMTSANYSIFKFPSAIFTQCVNISATSYVIRGFDTTVKTFTQIFIKGSPATGEMLRANQIFKEGTRSSFSNDGYLNYDKTNNQLIYVPFYGSNYYCLDTNLNVLNIRNTISPSQQTIKTDVIKSSNAPTLTNTTPVRVINDNGCLDNGLLYNICKIKADNQTSSNYFNSSAIDVYNLGEASYAGSFRIPSYRYEKLKDIKVFGRLIVVMFKETIITYNNPMQLDTK